MSFQLSVLNKQRQRHILKGMEKVSRRELFETVPVPKALMSMALPTVVSQLINLIYNLVDTFFIGRTGNSYMIASVSLSFTLFMMTIAMSNLFGVGGGSLMARLSGKHEDSYARNVSAFSFWGAVVIALSYSLLILVFMNPLLRLLGASDQTIGFAKQYVLIVVVIGDLPIVVGATLAHLLRNSGYSKQASFGLSMGGILNIALDPLFMFVLLPDGYEVVGAATATVLANVISCVYLYVKVSKLKNCSALSTNLKDAINIRKDDKRQLFKVGIPSSLLNALFDIANIFLNAIMATHGDLAVAALGICMKIERLPNALNVGLCQGMLPIVAYNYSSGNRERMNKTVKTARNYGLIIGFTCLLAYQIFARQLVGLFLSTNTEGAELAVQTLAFATSFLRIRIFANIFQFLNFHSSFNMQAIGDGKGTLIHCCARELCSYIPFMFIFNALFGIYGLVSSLIAGELCGAIVALFILKKDLKKIGQ